MGNNNSNMLENASQHMACVFFCIAVALKHAIACVQHHSMWLGLMEHQGRVIDHGEGGLQNGKITP